MTIDRLWGVSKSHKVIQLFMLVQSNDGLVFSLHILTERIRVVETGQGQTIFNNTVINSFMLPSFFDKREADNNAEYETPEEGESDQFLEVECSGVQGDHEVIWSTDNTVVGNPDGVVNCDSRQNSQMVLTNYTSRLDY